MTAVPPASPDFFAENAQNSTRAENAHVGLPSAATIEAEILPMSYEGADLTECVERILDLIRPAFEAKERAAEDWQTRATVYKRLMTDAQRDKAAAEAKLAQAVEALEPLVALANAYFYRYETQPGVFRESHQDDPDDRPVYGIAGTMLLTGHLRRARSASAAARGETR